MRAPDRLGLHLDVSGTVDLQRPRAVLEAILATLRDCYGPACDQALIERAVADVARAFRGDFPRLLRCDTHYHDLRHALDSGLAMARLVHGQLKTLDATAVQRLDARHAVLGILLALFHDIGLLRRDGETQIEGSQLTPVHEARSVEFMRAYLRTSSLAPLADKAQLIMVTRLVWHLPPVMDPVDRELASMLGTADIYTQLADRGYLEKCRDFLFKEFSSFGLAGTSDSAYPTAKNLLEKTPGFYTGLLRPRIDTEYGAADRYLQAHFDGNCPYAASVARNIDYLDRLLARDELELLRRRPIRIIDAAA